MNPPLIWNNAFLERVCNHQITLHLPFIVPVKQLFCANLLPPCLIISLFPHSINSIIFYILLQISKTYFILPTPHQTLQSEKVSTNCVMLFDDNEDRTDASQSFTIFNNLLLDELLKTDSLLFDQVCCELVDWTY